MKILKMYVARRYGNTHCYCLFDEIPEITYEKIGSSYVGSACDEDGSVIFSRHLGYDSYGKAFCGRELTLHMKDGTYQKIKDYWYDCGHYKAHGEFIDIGGGTLEDLQDCYVYCGYNINKDTFQKMLDDYYSREKEYEYYEIEKWAKMQYKWYPVVIDGKTYPVMVNEKGNFTKRETKEPVYPRRNICRYKKKVDKYFKFCFFNYSYNDGNRLIKIERKMLDVLHESLPFTKEKIIEKCKLDIG